MKTEKHFKMARELGKRLKNKTKEMLFIKESLLLLLTSKLQKGSEHLKFPRIEEKIYRILTRAVMH